MIGIRLLQEPSYATPGYQGPIPEKHMDFCIYQEAVQESRCSITVPLIDVNGNSFYACSVSGVG